MNLYTEKQKNQSEEYDETQMEYIHINFFVKNEKNKMLKKKINDLLKLSFKVNRDFESDGYLWLLGIYKKEEVIACVCVGYDKTIYSLAVNPSYRKYGIATKILTLMTQRCCIIKGLERPKIQIEKKNELYVYLLSLYQKVGFASIKEDDEIRTTLQYNKYCEMRDIKVRDEYWVNCREINSIMENNKFCFLCNEYLFKDIPKHVLTVSWLNKGETNIFMIGETHDDPLKYGSIELKLVKLFASNYTEGFREHINFFIEVTDTQISDTSKLYGKDDKIIHGPDRGKARKQVLSEARVDIPLNILPINRIRRRYYNNILNPSPLDILHVYSADHDNSLYSALGKNVINFSQRKDLTNICSIFFNKSIVPLLGEMYNNLKITDNKFTNYNGLGIIKTIIEDFNNMLYNDFNILITYISLLNEETEEFNDMITQLIFMIKRLSIDYFSFLKIISTNFSHTGGKNNIIFYGGFWHTDHLVRLFEIFDLKLIRSKLNSDKNNDQYKKLCKTNKKYRTPHFDQEFRFNSCVSFPKCESSEHSNSTSKLKEKTPPFIAEDDDNDLYSSDDDDLYEISDMFSRNLKKISLKRKRIEEEPKEKLYNTESWKREHLGLKNPNMEIDTVKNRVRRPQRNLH